MAALLFTSCTRKDSPAEAAEPADSAADPAKAPGTLDLWDGVPPMKPEATDIATELTPRPGPLKPESVNETIEVPFPP